MTEVQYGRGYAYAIQYHVVWCVKYRHDVLEGPVDADLKDILTTIAVDHGVHIAEMETDRNHIHLLIECKPQHYIPNLMKAFKGVSARRLFERHPELKRRLWKGHLWNPSYFIATVSDQTEEQIRQYIQKQTKQ